MKQLAHISQRKSKKDYTLSIEGRYRKNEALSGQFRWRVWCSVRRLPSFSGVRSSNSVCGPIQRTGPLPRSGELTSRSPLQGEKCRLVVSALIILAVAISSGGAQGADLVVELRFENNRFAPQTITVPVNQAFKIKVINASKETIEFESFKLNRERVVGPGETIFVNVPALSPGSYDFYDDFHDDVPEGAVIAR